MARIANLDADLALALRAPSVRIVAPIPGKGAVGVEVPNPEPRDGLLPRGDGVRRLPRQQGAAPLALGKDIAGRPYVADLAKMPHLLIAGATGSGKSVCVNTIITSLVYRHSPRSLRLLMVDPKMVELSMYNDLPAPPAPRGDRQQRRGRGAQVGGARDGAPLRAPLAPTTSATCRTSTSAWRAARSSAPPTPTARRATRTAGSTRAARSPSSSLIIDELADLMMTVQGDVEKPLALLAQKARAIGIHLILATQRPSVNVITGLIKANFPSRIAFRVSSKVDSRTILDQNGADSLLGNGDMLFLPPGLSDPLRLQGAFLSTEETERLMDWYRERGAPPPRGGARRGAEPDELTTRSDILEIVRAAEGDSGDCDAAEEALERPRQALPRGGRALHPAPGRLDLAAAAPPAHRLRPRRAHHRPAPPRRRPGPARRLQAARRPGGPHPARPDVPGGLKCGRCAGPREPRRPRTPSAPAAGGACRRDEHGAARRTLRTGSRRPERGPAGRGYEPHGTAPVHDAAETPERWPSLAALARSAACGGPEAAPGRARRGRRAARAAAPRTRGARRPPARGRGARRPPARSAGAGAGRARAARRPAAPAAPAAPEAAPAPDAGRAADRGRGRHPAPRGEAYDGVRSLRGRIRPGGDVPLLEQHAAAAAGSSTSAAPTAS